jgi:pyruvate dehydrogenase E1 component beta subunit
LKAAIRDNDPVIMESEQMYGDKGEVPDGEYTIPLLLISNVKVQM